MRMQYRITLSVALGLALILGVFAYLSVSAVEQSKDAAAQERLVWAKSMAVHVNDVLQRTLDRTELVAQEMAEAWQAGTLTQSPSPNAAFLFSRQLALFSSEGALLWSDAPQRQGVFSQAQPLIRGVSRQGKASIYPCAAPGANAEPGVCLVAPARGASGRLLGALAVELDLRRRDLNLIPSPQLGEGAHAELITDRGATVAADTPELIGNTPHWQALGSFVAAREPGVRVHTPPASSGVKSHVVAYAPIASVPGWGIAVEQERDVALAVASGIQRKFLLFGLLALVGAALLAWLDVRQVVRPLGMLTSQAARMASGDLESPIGLARRDEVGMLAQSFEKMRSQLKVSLEELGRRDRELEERVRQRTREVERLYAELQAKEELRSHLLEKLISAQEEERARIARELHDEAGQSLTGIVMSLEAAETSLPADSSPLKESLERAKAVALETIEEIRKLVVDLRPAALDDLGLAAALRAYAEERLAERGVKVDLEASELGQRLPPHVEGALFRVVQEAITNVARHAEAKTARIRLRRDDQRLTLLVEDDGKGFDMAEILASPDKTRALGLLGMQERVALCGGSLKVESAPGRGTQVRAEIPLPEEAAS